MAFSVSLCLDLGTCHGLGQYCCVPEANQQRPGKQVRLSVAGRPVPLFTYTLLIVAVLIRYRGN